MVVEIKKDNVKLLTVDMDDKNIRLKESYTITDPACMQEIINLIREEGKKLNLFYKRKDASWLREWKAHNMLYNAGLYKDRTAHTDLNEDESWFRRLGYWFLSLFYRH